MRPTTLMLKFPSANCSANAFLLSRLLNLFLIIQFFGFWYFRLWLSTINTLCHSVRADGSIETSPYTDEELTKDPLTVLRCERKVFR